MRLTKLPHSRVSSVGGWHKYTRRWREYLNTTPLKLTGNLRPDCCPFVLLIVRPLKYPMFPHPHLRAGGSTPTWLFGLVFLENEAKISGKIIWAMFYEWREGHMQKFRQFSATWKNALKFDIRRLCSQPFNYALSIVNSWHWHATPRMQRFTVWITLYILATNHCKGRCCGLMSTFIGGHKGRKL